MTKWSVKHRSILTLLCVILCVVGVFSFVTMERQENPEITSPIGTITCIYPGASPTNVEKQVVKLFEDELASVAEIKHIDSYALDSVGLLKITLKDISDAEIAETWTKVSDKIDTVKPELPASAYEPTLETDFASSYGLIIGLSSAEYNAETIHTAAKELQDTLLEDENVKEVSLQGALSQQIEVDLNMTKMQQYGIAPNTVATVVAARNVNIPGGNLELDGTKIPIEVTGEYKGIDELSHTIVSASSSGTPVYLGDIGTLRKTDQPADEVVRVNGVPGVLVGVKYADGIHIPNAQKKLMETLQQYRENSLYADMNMDMIYDQAVYIDDSIGLFTSNLMEAILLVLLVVLITMGIRSAVIVSLPIPITIFAVFIYMKLTGEPLHQVSIASLIICLSLLVANGIVSNDNINVYLERGSDIFTASTEGVKEVRIPILTSTLTTIASFLPLAMMQGSAGKFVKSLPILVSVALVVSYITSLTVVPALGFTLLRPRMHVKPKQRFAKLKANINEKLHLAQAQEKLENAYDSLLKKGLNKPKLVLLISLVAFVCTLFILPSMKVQLFPPITRDQYVINIAAQDGATIEKTTLLADKTAEVLKNEPSVEQFSYTIGKGYMKYYVTFFPNDQATNKAQFLIDGTRDEAENVEKRILESVPGVRTSIQYLEINLPAQWPIEVRISGDDTQTLRECAENVSEKIRLLDGVKSTEDNYGLSSYKLHVDVNEETASLVGLTNYEIASVVRMAVNGVEISQLKQEDMNADTLPIVAKIADEDKDTSDILNTIYMSSSVTGANIPLDQVAEVKTQSSLGKIIRRDNKRTITVGAHVADGHNTNEVQQAIAEVMNEMQLPEGYSVSYGGESENSVEAFSSLKIPMIIAIVLIYLILVFQFGDLAQPFIILGTIPLSFIGVFWGLKLMGYPIGFMALLGGISLMGVVVNNGIVLLDYIGIQINQFDDPKEAVTYACKTRLRPIMIGMVTTVISLLPLMISGGDLWAPLATAIVFGMLLSSVLTMFVVPAGYMLLHKNREKRLPFRAE